MKIKNLLTSGQATLATARSLAMSIRVGYWFAQGLYPGLRRRDDVNSIGPSGTYSFTRSIPQTLPEICQDAMALGFKLGSGAQPSGVRILDTGGRRVGLCLKFVGAATA